MTVEGRGWWKSTGVFEGFTEDQIDLDDASIFLRHGGDGPPVVLLHGHPCTSATWYQVAPRLVHRGFTVICPDLRGYGQSRAPEPAVDHTAHSKRATARDIVAVARALGHRRFALAGHDRGGYVALRLALDRPDAVSRLALLDCIPISEHLARITAEFATKCGTGSSSPTRRPQSASSMPTLKPGTAPVPRQRAGRVMTSCSGPSGTPG